MHSRLMLTTGNERIFDLMAQCPLSFNQVRTVGEPFLDSCYCHIFVHLLENIAISEGFFYFFFSIKKNEINEHISLSLKSIYIFI